MPGKRVLTLIIAVFAVFMLLCGCQPEVSSTEETDDQVETTSVPANTSIAEETEIPEESTSAVQDVLEQKAIKSRIEDLYQNGKLIRQSKTVYDENSNILKNSYSNYEDDRRYVDEYKYDDQGRKISKIFYENDEITEQLTYEYDDDGNLLRIAEHCEGYELEYEYNANGGLIKTVRHNVGSPDNVLTFERDSLNRLTKEIEYADDGSIDSQTEYTYDTSGNCIEETDYDASGNITEKYRREYDAIGNMTKQIQYTADGSIDYQMEYVYDTAGSLIETRRYDASGSITAKTQRELVYDKNGNIIEINQQLDGKTYKIIYTYEYFE